MPSSSLPVARAPQDSRQQDVLSAQVRLLYANANISFGVTVLAADMLVALEWGFVPNSVLLAWWLYMNAVAIARYGVARRYRRLAPEGDGAGGWLTQFVIGAALAGVGWGGAGILLYPHAQRNHQLFLVFVLGGMMLGAASLLAPRQEAFLAFLIPAGIGPALRLLLDGDETHFAMGLLAVVFTLAVVVTTYRINRTVSSSLELQFENRELVEDLTAAKHQAEALNQALEQRVEERTAELLQSAEQLRAEIAQRRQMEEELLRARKLESLGVLAGGIAHDFNNFLAIVQGNTEIAKSHIDPSDGVQENLDQTMEACRRAAFLSSQLLTFAKGGAPVRRAAPIGKLVSDAVRLARAGAPTSVAVQIAEDLGCAMVDPDQIGQVLHNILLNARQSMPDGGMIEVRVENAAPATPCEAGRIHISIRDYGCGIPGDILPRIFDPYFTTKPGGNGLGLATAYAIVAKHDGHITVDSTPGEGTVFTIDLPAVAEEPTPEADAPAGFPAQGGAERVLVMDDESAIRKLFRAVLGDLGYEVHTARDGAEAIAIYEAARATGKRFDAVLLDLTVSGGMGGVETAAKLKEIDPTARLIVSSGYADAPVMSDFAGYGFDGVIPKPWTTKMVAEVFRKVLAPQPERKLN
jgi:signal transduction histidine kinase/ActR/RegA family two-component response regulator